MEMGLHRGGSLWLGRSFTIKTTERHDAMVYLFAAPEVSYIHFFSFLVCCFCCSSFLLFWLFLFLNLIKSLIVPVPISNPKPLSRQRAIIPLQSKQNRSASRMVGVSPTRLVRLVKGFARDIPWDFHGKLWAPNVIWGKNTNCKHIYKIMFNMQFLHMFLSLSFCLFIFPFNFYSFRGVKMGAMFASHAALCLSRSAVSV